MHFFIDFKLQSKIEDILNHQNQIDNFVSKWAETELA